MAHPDKYIQPQVGDVIYQHMAPQRPLRVVEVSSSGHLDCVNLKGERVGLKPRAGGYPSLQHLVEELERKLANHQERLSDIMLVPDKKGPALKSADDNRFQALLDRKKEV